MFTKTGGKHAKRIEAADGRTFEFGNTTVKFSFPVFHGPEDSPLGWLLMSTIRCGAEKVLFASDVQGPMHTPTLEMIIDEKPEVAIIGGPPIYLADRVRKEHIQKGMKNLEVIVKKVPITILEHHILREEKWQKSVEPLSKIASETGHRIVTAAEFLGEENNLLESRRKLIFTVDPPNNEFEKWMRLPLSKRKLTRPPI